MRVSTWLFQLWLVVFGLLFPRLSWAAPSAQSIELWHAYPDGGRERAELTRQVRKYEQNHPGVRVNLLHVPHGGYAAKLAAAIPRGNGPHLFVDAHERIGNFRSKGLIGALPAGQSPALWPKLRPEAVRGVSLGAQRYGVPLSEKCLALYVNRSLLPQPIRSFGDLERAQGHLPKGAVLIAHSAGSAYGHAPFLHGFGGRLLNADGSYGASTPAGAASLRWLMGWVNAGKIAREADGALVTQLFASAKAATAISGPWMADSLPKGQKVEVIPLPQVPGAPRATRPLLTVEVLFATPKGAASKAALGLLGYLGSQDVANDRSRATRAVSPFRTPSPASKRDPLLRGFRAAVEGARLMPTARQMRLVFEPTERAIKSVLRGQSEPVGALAAAKRRFDDVLRPLPDAKPPGPYALALGALALGLGALLWRSRQQDPGRVSVRRSLPAYGYLVVALLAVLLLVILPLALGTATSFFAGEGPARRFVGFAHYAAILSARGGPLLSSGSFYAVLLVTIFWTLCNLALHLLLGVSLALLLARKKLRFSGFYRVLLIVPWAVPSYVTALAWKGMFHRQFGAVNALLAMLGVEPVSWFAKFSTAFCANLTTNVWLGFPFMMVVTLGAITSIPQEVLEAAEVDGATAFQRLRLIIFPMIRPTLLPSVALGAIWTFNMFNVVFLVSGGGPDGQTEILVSEAYRWAFTRDAQIGYAAAYAMLIFLLLFLSSRAAQWSRHRLVGAGP